VDDVSGWDFAYGDNSPADGHGQDPRVRDDLAVGNNGSIIGVYGR
jgi:hypothetical protein